MASTVVMIHTGRGGQVTQTGFFAITGDSDTPLGHANESGGHHVVVLGARELIDIIKDNGGVKPLAGWPIVTHG